MPLDHLIVLMLTLAPYLIVHGVIVFILLRFRRRLPPAHRKISPHLLVATATPLIGPFVSSWAFSRLARCAQAATSHLTTYRSDCGHGAGIAYGLIYSAAAWVQSPALGALALALLLAYLFQLRSALNAIRPSPKHPMA